MFEIGRKMVNIENTPFQKEFKHECFLKDKFLKENPINFEKRECNLCQCSICEENMSLNPLDSCSKCRDNMGTCFSNGYL